MGRQLKQLKTADAVIDVLGGTTAVAELVGAQYVQRVSNWRKLGFPANTYLLLSQALAKRGYEAPPSLWDMCEPQEARP